MMSCASAALATAALFPQAARAQAFQGSITSSTGSVTRSTPTTTTETLTIGTNTATINWNPNNQQPGGAPLDFLPAGNTATFTSTPGVTDYTVLNRILPESGQAIALNGHVISTLQGTSATGGHVWFYAPGGIVVGASAVFDVGGLLLTTNDVTSFGTTANGFNASFSGPSGSTSSIQVQNGAQINALQQNSYVALVAPRIEQGGKVRVNGSAAYAAGEQLSLTMNQGLFDIQVDVGTSDSNGIVHTGETSGPANVTSADNHKIYMVAVPKNQALTMLLGGTVGFDDAVSANVKNGEIFLSSGWGLHDSDGSGFYYTSTPGLNAGIEIGAGHYTSDLTAYGQGTLEAVADTANITFGGNVFLDTWSGAGPLSASLVASNEHTLSVAGNVTLNSSLPNDLGSASIIANSGGLVSIGGNAGVFSTGPGTSGGDTSFVADGGSISVAGLANLSATGSGGAQISSESAGADAQGGSVSVSASDGGSVTTGGMVLNALGAGQANTGTGNGGAGSGGSILMESDSGGAITVNGNLTANAGGVGGNASSGEGGFGQGGSTDLFIDGGALTVTGSTFLIASGIGGAGGTQGGNGDGGLATVDIFGGSANFTGATTINISSTGGNASNGTGGAAGLEGESFAEIESSDGGSLTAGNLTVNANAIGGNGLTAGAAAGGEIDLFSDDFDTDATTNMAFQQLSLSANGTTGNGGVPGEIISTGGFVSLLEFGGTISANSLSAQANGTNIGGEVSLEADTDGFGNPASMHFGSTDAQANGGDFGGFIFAATTSGSSIDLGDATLRSIGGFGGSIFLFAGTCTECGGEGEIALNEAPLPAGGGIAANNLTLDTTGNIFVELSAGADVSVSGTLNGNAGQIISLIDDGTGGAIRAHEIDLNAITIDDSADIVADIIRFTTPSSMTLGNLSATDQISLEAGDELTTGDLAAGGEIDLHGTDISFGNVSADTFNFGANGSVNGGNITVSTRAGGDADGAVVLGNITAGPNLPTGNEFSVGISSGTSITVGDVAGPGHVGFATLGDLRTGNLTAGDLVMLLVGGDIDTGSITTSPTGRVYIANASMFLAAGGGGDDSDFDPNAVLALAPVATGGSILIGGPVTTGQMQAAAGGNLTLADVTAGNDVTLSAGGLATFNGMVRSPTITVTSGDIDVTEGASLGVSGVTNLLTLNAISHGLPIVIGDDGSSEGNATGQYHLSEDGDIRATSVVINAQGAVPGFTPDVQVFDVNIEGSATAGGGISNVTLNTGGSVFVNGNADFINAAPTDSLTINAGHVIEVNTDTGRIQITDSSGALTGILNLSADNIWVASGSVLDQLETDMNFAGRDAALAANSGTANPDGFLRAGTINTSVADSLLVQNSGTSDLFGGIDTGAGGLSIASTGTTPATLIVFGRQTDEGGTVITNQDFLGSVDLSGTGGFTDDSSVNGCAIGGECGQAPQATPGIDMASILGPLDETNSPSDEDKKKKDKEGEESDDGSSADPSLRLINTTPINNAPPIDEPVTSGGDVVIGGGTVQPN
jgi:filamentous hemagglutinin family protein